MLKAMLEPINSISQAVRVEVPGEVVQASRKTILTALGKEMKLAGFRQGKIPLDLIEQRLGKDADKEIVQQVVRDTYPEAIQQVAARPISDPRIEAGNFKQRETFSYRAVFEIFPEVTVEKYEGLKLTRDKIDVSDEDVNRELKLFQQRMTQLEPAPEAELGEGMMALIDFTGTADGKPFEGSVAQNFVVDFGSGNLLSHFEEQVRGMTVGNKRHICVQYPADYFNKEVAGKEGRFEVQVKEMRRKIVPELNDDFAQSLGNFSTLDHVRDDLKKRIAGAQEEIQRRRLHRQVIEQLAEKYAIDVPEVMVSAELSAMLEQLNRDLQARGQTLEQAGVDAQSFVKTNHQEALLRTRGFLLVHAVGKKEGMKVTEDELQRHLTVLAAQSGQPEAKVRAHVEKHQLMSRIESELFLEKSLDFIVGKAKISEVRSKNEKKK